ncbi:MAG: hypothetical protein HC890_07775 [Chloroflexaceae bacterium]|nr:hypothetical protein [Chloroflexaceae bacterium]
MTLPLLLILERDNPKSLEAIASMLGKAPKFATELCVFCAAVGLPTGVSVATRRRCATPRMDGR